MTPKFKSVFLVVICFFHLSIGFAFAFSCKVIQPTHISTLTYFLPQHFHEPALDNPYILSHQVLNKKLSLGTYWNIKW